MNNTELKKSTIIRNAGVIDLRDATEESVSNIKSIQNVGALLLTKKTAHLAAKMSIGNVGSSIEVPESLEFNQHTGLINFSHSNLLENNEPTNYLIIGSLTFEKDVTAEDINKAIGKMVVIGDITCPKGLTAIIQQKLISLTGLITETNENEKVVKGMQEINNAFLKGLEKPVTLSLIGKANMVSDIDEDLFCEKILGIKLIGKINVSEKNVSLLNRRIADQITGKINIIPEGYAFIQDSLTINSHNIKKFTDAKIFSSNQIEFSPEVTPEMLEKHIKSIITTDKMIISNEKLQPILSEICDNPAQKILTYSDRLVIVKDEYLLTSSELEYSPDSNEVCMQLV
jgi:hypothetical protein